MGRAVRAVTTERGRDPRTLTMAAFGGAGPVHAAELARQLGLPKVIVPPLPGVFSSLGLLLADMRFDFVRPVMRRSDDLTAADLKEFYSQLETRATRDIAKEGIEPSGAKREWVAELRYDGQSSELTIASDPSQSVEDLVAAFGAEHERAYGHSSKDEVVVFTSLHLRLRSPSSRLSYADVAAMAAARGGGGEKGERRVYFGRERGWLATPIVHRADLAPGASGPLVVAEYDTNVVVPPGFSATLDEYQDIILVPS
jgi:N-methylhydantoinase A